MRFPVIQRVAKAMAKRRGVTLLAVGAFAFFLAKGIAWVTLAVLSWYALK